MQQYSAVRSGEYYQVDLYGCREISIFKDDADYTFFFLILKKYLLNNKKVELLAYCLKADGAHVLLYQLENEQINILVRGISRDYDEYYFDKYKIQNILSSGSHVIAKIDICLIMKASKNIHLMPEDWLDYPYSSIRAYLYDDTPDWLNKGHIVDLCGTTENYYSYINRVVAK